MTENLRKRNNMWRWGMTASVFVHAVIAFLVLVGIPFEFPKPQAEESVSVEIVTPPEQPPAEEPVPEPPAAEEAVSPPEQPKAEEPPAEAEQPKPPEEQERQEDQKQEAQQAPPQEQQAQQQAEPEPPPPPPPPATETQNAESAASGGRPLDAFRPVFQFGEKDTGPKVAEDGDSAEQADATDEPAKPEPEEQAATENGETDPASGNAQAADQADPSSEAAQQTDVAPDDQSDPAGAPLPDGIAVPDVGLGAAVETANGAATPPVDPNALLAELSTTKPSDGKDNKGEAGEQEGAGAAAKPPALKPAQRLFSSKATNDPMATIAMGSMSRGERAAELCNTELREQLRQGSPSYSPNLLPKPRLTNGNVIDVTSVGFRARDQWYDVSFRCEVDKDATKVVSFAHQVGGAIPRSEWRKRGFPAY